VQSWGRGRWSRKGERAIGPRLNRRLTNIAPVPDRARRLLPKSVELQNGVSRPRSIASVPGV